MAETINSLEQLGSVAAVAAVAQAGFDPHAWGNLMGFEEDDLDYVAGKKGVDIALIRRAYKLQKLDAELS